MSGHLEISRRLLHVWARNFTVYRRTWKIGFLPPLLDPMFFILAFGWGLGSVVGTMPYGGAQVPYLAFIAPAIVAVSMMQQGFFETTYASYVRMFYQKTFDAMLATPLSLGDVIAGEIVWGATKAVIATALMMAALTPFGLVGYPEGLLALPLAFLGGVAFGSAGMICTALVPSIEVFNLPTFLFITPMFLFSGTFFPLENMPDAARAVALCLPLTHLAELVRAAFLNALSPRHWANLAYLAAFTAVTFPLAVRRMHKRLIR